MIIPFLDGFLPFSKAPVTWMLILLNTFLFSQNMSLSKDCRDEIETYYGDKEFLYTQGQVYRQFSNEREIAQVKDSEVLGRLAFRDEAFLNEALTTPWVGDPVAIKKWKSNLSDFLVTRAYYPPFLLGVSSKHQDFFSTISYQFYHDGFYHLLGNVLLILIIGGYLERRYRGMTVLVLYLIGGCLAALAFTMTANISGAPLVGASGSVCALLGFLFYMERKKETRLFYIVLPIKKYLGFVFVPTMYWVLWLCMIEDVSGYLSQSSFYSGGVAHLIHLLGFVVGIGLGIIYQRFFSSLANVEVMGDAVA